MKTNSFINLSHLLVTTIILLLPIDAFAQIYSHIKDLNDHSFERISEAQEYNGRLFLSMSSKYDNETGFAGILSEIDANGDEVWSVRTPDFNVLWKSNLIFSGDSVIQVGFERINRSAVYFNIYSLDGDQIDFIEMSSEEFNADEILPIGVIPKLIDGKVIIYGQLVHGVVADEEIFACISKISLEFGKVDTSFEYGIGIGGSISDACIGIDQNLHFIHRAIEYVSPNSSFREKRLYVYTFANDLENFTEWESDAIDDSMSERMAIDVFSNGDFLIPGGSEQWGDKELWRVDATSGEIMWKHEFADNINWKTVNILDVDVTANDNVLVTGYFPDRIDIVDENVVTIPYLGLFSGDGEILWERFFEYEPGLDQKLDAFFMYTQELADGSISCGGAASLYYLNNDNEMRRDFDSWLVKVDENGCIMDDCNYVTVGTFDELQLTKDLDNIILFPNPTKGLISLDYNREFNFEKINIYDLQGHTLFSVSFEGNSIDVSELSTGMYLLEIIDNKGNSIVKKIVKQ